MKGVTVEFFQGGFSTNLKADTARFNKNSSSGFSDGSIVSIDSTGQTTNIQFEEYTYPFVEDPGISKNTKRCYRNVFEAGLKAENI